MTQGDRERKIIWELLLSLPYDEQEKIISIANSFITAMKKIRPSTMMGVESVVELLAKLGIFLNGKVLP